MKKANLLSKAELKKIKGGNPAWSATCSDPISGSAVCYDRINTCTQFCPSGWSCTVNTGVVGCN